MFFYRMASLKTGERSAPSSPRGNPCDHPLGLAPAVGCGWGSGADGGMTFSLTHMPAVIWMGLYLQLLHTKRLT